MRVLLLFATFSLLLGTGCTRTSSTQVDSSQKINELEGNFNATLTDDDQFGRSVANIGDLESDGVTDLAVGVPFADDGGTDRGAVWVLFMDDNGQVDVQQKISNTEGGFSGGLDNDDQFGTSVTAIGDLNDDGVIDLVVGVPGDDDGGTDRGALWVLFLNSDGTVNAEQKIASGVGGFGGILDDGDRFGSAIANINDLNNDGVIDIAVGVELDDDDGTDRGAVWILFMNSDGTVSSEQKISSSQGSFGGGIDDNDMFGSSITRIGDLNGDGISELAVGVSGDDDGGFERGALWILFMNANGTVNTEQKISQTSGLFDGILSDGDEFGSAVTSLGDVDNDGYDDIVVGAKFGDDGGPDRGAVWILFLDKDGKVLSFTKISDLSGGFNGTLVDDDQFGYALTSIGDLDGDGFEDLVVTASGDEGNGVDRGALWILFIAEVEGDTEFDSEIDMGELFSGNR